MIRIINAREFNLIAHINTSSSQVHYRTSSKQYTDTRTLKNSSPFSSANTQHKAAHTFLQLIYACRNRTAATSCGFHASASSLRQAAVGVRVPAPYAAAAARDLAGHAVVEALEAGDALQRGVLDLLRRGKARERVVGGEVQAGEDVGATARLPRVQHRRQAQVAQAARHRAARHHVLCHLHLRCRNGSVSDYRHGTGLSRLAIVFCN
jgi:hypothetical protein